MSTRSSAESSASASISIDEAFAYCRAHPLEGVDLQRFLGIFVSGPDCILDARDHGLLGVVMDRLLINDGAKPFEWIGGTAAKVAPEAVPDLLERLTAIGHKIGAPAIDMTLHAHWLHVREELRACGATPRYVDVEMTRPNRDMREPAPLPQGWRWVPAVPDHEGAYYDLLLRSLGPMPGVYMPPEAEAIASMRTTAEGSRVLLDEAGRARALVRCKIEKRYIHLLARCPEMRGRGLGALALGEAERLLGPGPLHLSVVKQNQRAHDFYRHNGFRETEEIETWQLRIAP